MSKEWNDFFKEIREDYYKVLDDVNDEINCILNTPESECNETDDSEYIKNAIAESHSKNIVSVMSCALDMFGKFIEGTISNYEYEDSYSGRTDFQKGDHLCTGSCHGLYVGCEKVIFYSKGYDLFPEIKIVPLGVFAKNGSIKIIKHSSRSAEKIIKRAMSQLGKRNFKNSESFVSWCTEV
ncbi:MAG: hypothetical protein IJZ72_08185 [Oscillospiraceae bacterium]|nr:hypothetical protein [Oscillospiraceae bacterium]